jgi:hypothetical protein
MKRCSLLVVFVTLVLLLSLNGYFAFGASPLDPEIEAKIKNQEIRIQEALKTKQMAPEEAKKLQDNLDNIRQQASSVQSQGKMNADQKNLFNQMLEKNSQAIESKKANRMKTMQPLFGPMQTVQGWAIKQQKMINHRVETKSLTQGEADILKANIDNIKKEEARLQAAKKLTAEEQARLFKLLDANEAMIRDKQNHPIKSLFSTNQREFGTTTKQGPMEKPSKGSR